MPTPLPTLIATRWIDFKGSGRTQPALIGCDLPDGSEIECVVKLNGHKESAPHQPICEIVAALLAVDLGLPIADPILVEITPDFANHAVPVTNSAARMRCQQAIGWSFATRHLPPGFSILPVGKPPARQLLPSLAELYAFDGLIQNADRSSLNPNCLVKGNELKFFDHDQAFGFLLDIWGAAPVSKVESYGFLKRHIAHPHLTQDRNLFQRIEGAWEAITDDTLNHYLSLIPDAWPGKKTSFPKIEAHLKVVHTRLASALDAITLTIPPT